MFLSALRCARAHCQPVVVRSLLTTPARATQQSNLLAVTRRCMSNAAKNAAPKKNAKRDFTSSWALLKKLFAVAKPEYGRLACACALLLMSTGVTMAVPASIGYVIDMIYSSAQEGDAADMRRKLTSLVELLIAIFVIGAAANCGRIYLIQTSAARVIRRLREKVFSNVARQEMAFFDSTHSGQLISRLYVDCTTTGKAVTNNVSDGLRAFLRGGIGLGMMFYLSPPLATASLVIVPPISCLAAMYGVYIRRITQETQDAIAISSQVAEEKISNMRTVRFFGQERNEMKRYNNELRKILHLMYRESTANSVFFGAAGLLGNLAGIAVIWKGGVMMQSDAITVGQLTSFLVYLAYTGMSVGGVASFTSELMKGVGASTRIWELAERQPAIPITGGLQLSEEDLCRGIYFRNVQFAYPTRQEVAVFNQLNLELAPGKVTAVVGVSGSGKSSLANLLLRLYDCTSGSILIGDTDIKDIDPEWLRTHVGIVAQEPVLFSGTLAQNIGYGRPGVFDLIPEQQRKALEDVAKKANAMEFIDTFPQRLETEIGEHGVQLSGGQKQRIAIARALLKNPKVLILDEATSALDTRSEKLVQQALETLMAGRTVLTIAHRLSTVINADQIVVLRDGLVAEQGSYQSLMAKPDGHFKKLVNNQALVA